MKLLGELLGREKLIWTRLAVVIVALWSLGAPSLRADQRLNDAPAAELRYAPYAGDAPRCDYPFVAARIMRDFVDHEEEYWRSGLEITQISDVRETGYRKRGLSYVPRRYCEAYAVLNNGEKRRIAYEIGEDLGFMGIGYGVSWRIEGLDRQRETSFGHLSR
ncbi:MAG TPA: hypothetical protein VEH76_13895 [Methylocystis sp.]|nr:hypothetical protein [Methylocystis sp.]